MSWDAALINVCTACKHKEQHGSWHYTHNCNAMLSAALEDVGYVLESHWLIGHMGKSWFRVLDGLNGRDGAALLSLIISMFVFSFSPLTLYISPFFPFSIAVNMPEQWSST